MDAVRFIEDTLVESLLTSLSTSDLKHIDSASRIFEATEYDTIEEMKEEVWRILLSYIDTHSMIIRIAEHSQNTDSDDETSEEENEEEE